MHWRIHLACGEYLLNSEKSGKALPQALNLKPSPHRPFGLTTGLGEPSGLCIVKRYNENLQEGACLPCSESRSSGKHDPETWPHEDPIRDQRQQQKDWWQEPLHPSLCPTEVAKEQNHASISPMPLIILIGIR